MLDIDPTGVALVCSDHQNDLCHPDGMFAAFNFPQEVARRNVQANTRRLLDAFRELRLPVVHVVVLFRPGGYGTRLNLPLFQTAVDMGAMVEGSWGAEIHETTRPVDGEIVVEKRRISGFHGTDLQNVLLGLGVTTVVFTGVVTNYSVEGTVRDAADRGWDCIVAEDCASTGSEEGHQASLQSMALLATISNSVDIVAALRA
jgi:biuret amidohydrolase